MLIKRFWVKNYKSLRDVELDFPTKLTVVFGPSGSGKTALAEAFLLLSDAAWGRAKWREELRRGASVGIEIERGCEAAYEVRIDETAQTEFEVRCPHVDVDASGLVGADQLSVAVGAALYSFLKDVVVITNIDWKAVRSPQPRPLVRQERLLPDVSNFVPYLYTVTGNRIPESLVEAVKYVFPDVRDMWFEEEGGRLLLKLATTNGVVLDQTNMPAGVLKTLIMEAALHANPALVVIDEFENSLHPEVQQVVLLNLENGETKARRLGKDVEEKLKKSGLTLSELIESGLLETA
jgi:predicted ATPase